MVWCGVVWYGMVCCCVVWYDTVRHGVVQYDMIWYGMVWYSMVWHLWGDGGSKSFQESPQIGLSLWRHPRARHVHDDLFEIIFTDLWESVCVN